MNFFRLLHLRCFSRGNKNIHLSCVSSRDSEEILMIYKDIKVRYLNMNSTFSHQTIWAAPHSFVALYTFTRWQLLTHVKLFLLYFSWRFLVETSETKLIPKWKGIENQLGTLISLLISLYYLLSSYFVLVFQALSNVSPEEKIPFISHVSPLEFQKRSQWFVKTLKSSINVWNHSMNQVFLIKWSELLNNNFIAL